MSEHQVNVRYMVNDVKSSVEWYTKHLDFKLLVYSARDEEHNDAVELRHLILGTG